MPPAAMQCHIGGHLTPVRIGVTYRVFTVQTRVNNSCCQISPDQRGVTSVVLVMQAQIRLALVRQFKSQADWDDLDTNITPHCVEHVHHFADVLAGNLLVRADVGVRHVQSGFTPTRANDLVVAANGFVKFLVAAVFQRICAVASQHHPFKSFFDANASRLCEPVDGMVVQGCAANCGGFVSQGVLLMLLGGLDEPT